MDTQRTEVEPYLKKRNEAILKEAVGNAGETRNVFFSRGT